MKEDVNRWYQKLESFRHDERLHKNSWRLPVGIYRFKKRADVRRVTAWCAKNHSRYFVNRWATD
jgi:hypothetical protein